MVEEIGQILGRGFDTYKRNFNIAVPFVLSILVTVVFSAILLLGAIELFFKPYIPTLISATSDELYTVILLTIYDLLPEIVFLLIILILVNGLVQSFFNAGAIGMARQATEIGTSELSTMMDYGKKNFVNLFLANMLVELLMLAGIVFIVPGALKGNLTLSSPDMGTIILLIIGFLLLVLYLLVLGIVLAIFMYALVVENLGPIDGIITGVNFFKTHKFDVFMLWLVQITIGIIIFIIGQVVQFVPVLGTLWPIINIFISVVIIMPLATIWWVRLYMSGTDKKLYFNELLLHPSDLEKLEAD